MPRINFGPMTEEQAALAVESVLEDAADVLTDEVFAQVIMHGLKINDDARATVYDALRKEFE